MLDSSWTGGSTLPSATYLNTVFLSWVAPHTNFLFYYLLNSLSPLLSILSGLFTEVREKGECDPDTSSSACSDKQGNIPPADSWHAIVTCCWILFQTVRPLAECLAFKCVQARVCTHACMWNSWFISTLYFTVVLVHSKRILHNLKKTLIYFILFFWSHRSVTSFFSPECVGSAAE